MIARFTSGLAVLILMLAATASHAQADTAFQTVRFEDAGGLLITGDWYPALGPGVAPGVDPPVILALHQAGSSRGEYRNIAPRLTRLGFHVLALDQRAGAQFGPVINGTATRARRAGLSTNFGDALHDVRAALTWIGRTRGPPTCIIIGSSYSASLALWMAGMEPEGIGGAVAFSPGEYFRIPNMIRQAAEQIRLPVMIASPKAEERQWQAIYEAIPGPKQDFTTVVGGRHGASSLIAERNTTNPEAYWLALEEFLAPFAPRATPSLSPASNSEDQAQRPAAWHVAG